MVLKAIATSLDPDQPAMERVAWSGSKLFVTQSVLLTIICHSFLIVFENSDFSNLEDIILKHYILQIMSETTQTVTDTAAGK